MKYGDPLGAAPKHPPRPRPTCTIKECEKKVEVLREGLCKMHLRRKQRHGDPLVVKHEHSGYRMGDPCTVEGCHRDSTSRGFCERHYFRFRRYGSPLGRPESVARHKNRETPDTRVCRRCDQVKSLDEFGVDHGDPSWRCRDCATAYYRANRERALANKAMKTYGLTREQYAELMADPACRVCGATAQSSGRRLAIDHCHATGKVRGLLCTRCNTALGMVDDDIDRLLALIDYVRMHREGDGGGAA